MKNNDFWFVSLCALLVIANVNDSVFARIALGANAIVVLMNVIKEIKEIVNGRKA